MSLRTALIFTLARHTIAFRAGKTHQSGLSARQHGGTTAHNAKELDKSLGTKGADAPAAPDWCAIGTSKMGVGPIIQSKDCDDWADWGLALSGNGLMAEAAAAGVLKAIKEDGMFEWLSTISSVSGGSWFNTQFAYSKDYYEGVVGEKSLEEFYTDYQGKAMGGMMTVMPKVMQGEMGWEGMITAMHAGFDSTQTNLPATNSNRKGMKNADLLICTTLVGGSLLSDNRTIAQVSSQDGTKAFYSNPAFWLIPTSGSESWNVPGIDLASAKLETDSLPAVPIDEKVLPAPSVTKVSAMSSAANGITANPELTNLFQSGDPTVSNGEQYVNVFGSGLAPSNGVCTTEGESCSFPSMMAIDGCYVDNLGLALNVGYLQKKQSTAGKSLSLLAVSSELCDRTSDPTCLKAVSTSAFRSLFADAPYSEYEGWLPDKVPGPSRAIFAESITDEEALGQQTGYGGMTFMTGTFTTVQNDHFGVTAGTKVSLVVLNVNGPLYLQPAGPGVPEGGMEGLSSVAVNAYNSVRQISKALTINEKVTSDSAFLYYQTVKTAGEEGQDS